MTKWGSLTRACALGAASAGLLMAVAGCSGSDPGAPQPPGETPVAPPNSVALMEAPGWPASAPIEEFFPDEFPTPPAGWFDEGRRTFTIVTWGSSACPFVATDLTVVDEGTLAARFEVGPADACTDDLAPRTHQFRLPAEITTDTVTVQVETFDNAFGQAEPEQFTVRLGLDYAPTNPDV